jgi:hypothetical protein
VTKPSYDLKVVPRVLPQKCGTPSPQYYLQNSIAALVSKIFAFEGSTIKGAILPIALEGEYGKSINTFLCMVTG